MEPEGTPNIASAINVTIEDVTNDLEAQEHLEVISENHIAEPESLAQVQLQS